MVKRRKSKKLLRFSRPLTSTTSHNGTTQNDTFGYNPRSELTSATLGNANYAYAFDNIGNRETSSEAGTTLAYTANNLNQYTSIAQSSSSSQEEGDRAEGVVEALTYDTDGNAMLVRTSTGTWSITYNGANRPVRFRNEETDTTVECGYDSQGRRYFKKVTVAGTVTLHHRYIYRGYLQIACVDCTRSGHPALWFVTWDPSQPTATRPLAIQKDGTWFTYGYDITKNVCEVFGPAGYIRTSYSYAPFGDVTESGDVSQPFQWSSEHYDSELDLVYYNFRHYSPSLGRFLSRDPIAEQGGLNLYAFVKNNPNVSTDFLGQGDFTIPIDAYLLNVSFSVSYGITSSFFLVQSADGCPNKEPGEMSPYIEVGLFDYGVFVKGGLIGETSDITFQTRLGIRTNGDSFWGRLWNFEIVSEVSISTNMEWQRLVSVPGTNICGCVNVKGNASVALEVEIRLVKIAAVAVMIEILPATLPTVAKTITGAIGSGITRLAIPALA